MESAYKILLFIAIIAISGITLYRNRKKIRLHLITSSLYYEYRE